MIIADSREQKNAHVLKYFTDNGIAFMIQKMDVADYMIEGKPNIVVDRKQNLDEIAHNLMSTDKGRFWREMRRAYDKKINMYVLCEHGEGIHMLKDVGKWRSSHSAINGKSLRDKMLQCERAYGIKFIFCEKKDTGRMIIELLNGDDKNGVHT